MRKRVIHLVMVAFLIAGWASPALAEKDSPFLFSVFKSFISTTDGKRCDHVPSCARYAKYAVDAHGPIGGFVLACDRLIRCGGDDSRVLRKVAAGGDLYAWDPVSENDFWWNQKAIDLKNPRNNPDFLVFKDWK